MQTELEARNLLSKKHQTSLMGHFDTLPAVFAQGNLLDKDWDHITACKELVSGATVYVRGDFWCGGPDAEKAVLFKCVVKE